MSRTIIESRKKHGVNRLSILNRRRGAVTLFLCLVLGSAASLLLLCLQAAVIRRDEAALVRAGHAAAESSLASYEIALLEDYGIWAVESSNISDQAFYMMIDNNLEAASVALSGADSSFDNDRLSEQIAAYMKIRAPAIWLGKLADSLSELRVPDLSYESGTVANTSDIANVQQKAQEILIQSVPDNLSLTDINSCLDWLFSSVAEPLKGIVANNVSSQIEQMIENTLPVFPEDFGTNINGLATGSLPDYFNPDDLAAMAVLADKLLSAPEHANGLVLAEYCLAVFPAQVTSNIDRETGEEIQILTPDGRAHDNLTKRITGQESDSVSLRENELEMILTGQDDPQRAANRMKSNIMMLRSVIRIIETISDQEKMNSFRPAAQVISSLIAAASAGSIYIDPEIITWLIAVADSIKSAFDDTKDLIAGKSVALWTYGQQSFVYFTYHDYMRLFLLIKPEDVLLTNIGETIKRNHPGDYFSSISTVVANGDTSCSFESSYRVHRSDGGICYEQNN